ncbi:MAG: hypothetical protein ACLQVD_06155 [Capsulimonadaceae bacterium]
MLHHRLSDCLLHRATPASVLDNRRAVQCSWLAAPVVILLLAGPVMVAPAGAGTPEGRYVVIDIGVQPVSGDVAPGLNDSGQVAFWTRSSDGVVHPALWDRGHLRILPEPSGYRCGVARGVDKRGNLIGWVVAGTNPIDNNVSTHAFEGMGGGAVDLGTLGGRDSQAFGTNDQGDVVGVASVATKTRHAFVYRHGRMTDLGTLPGGDYSCAYAVNNRGDAVGGAVDPRQSEHAVLWGHHGIVDLGMLPEGHRSRATGINSHGDIVGFSEVRYGDIDGFLYSHGHMIDLGEITSDPTRADGINDLGQIVGASEFAKDTRHAFLWENGKIHDLNGLIPSDSPWKLEEACAINNQSQIVAVGAGPDRVRHILLLTPTATSGVVDQRPGDSDGFFH